MLRQAGIGKLLCLALIWASGTGLLATTAFAGVQRFTDGNGTIIITNQKVETAKSPSRGVDPPPRASVPQAAPRIVPSAFPASETPSRPSIPTAAAPRGIQAQEPSGSEGGILRYRDDQGILHITNVPAREAGWPSRAEEGLALEARLQQAEVLLASAQDTSPPAPEPPSANSTQEPPIADSTRAAPSGKPTQEATSGSPTREEPGASSQIQRRREHDGTYVITSLIPPRAPPDEIPKVLKPNVPEAGLPSRGEEELALETRLKQARVVPASAQDARPPARAGPSADSAREPPGTNFTRGPPGVSPSRDSPRTSFTGEEPGSSSQIQVRREHDGTCVIANLVPCQNLKDQIPEVLKPKGAGAGLPSGGEEELALRGRLQQERVLLVSAPAARPPARAAPRSISPGEAPGAINQIQVRRKRDGTYVITNQIPRRKPLDGIPEVLKPILAEASWHYGLPLPLIGALIKAESNFNPEAVSPKGAMGLMQLMPGTASALGVRDPFCPRENVLAGCRYFRYLLNMFDQSLPLALAAYNAGHQRVVNAGYRVPWIKETQEFVTIVLENYYRTAPQSRLF